VPACWARDERVASKRLDGSKRKSSTTSIGLLPWTKCERHRRASDRYRFARKGRRRRSSRKVPLLDDTGTFGKATLRGSGRRCLQASKQQCSAAVQSSRCPGCAEQQCGGSASTSCESDAA